MGFNTDKFDSIYLDERAKLCGVDRQMYANLSRNTHRSMAAGDLRFARNDRMANAATAMVKSTLQSSAYGKNVSQRFSVPGRLDLDVLLMCLRNFKLSSYKLDSIAAEVGAGGS